MNMKAHILTALREQLIRWEDLIQHLRDDQIRMPLAPSNWSTKDVMAHLMTWQQRSIARLEAALSDREPTFPTWAPGVDPELLEATDKINDWIHATNRDKPWDEVLQNWRSGFLHFLELGDKIPESGMMDESRYSWMDGRPLGLVCLSTYDHHQEHLDKLVAWLREHGEL